MAEKHVVKFSDIMKFFKDEEKLIEKGENALEAQHVRNMVFDSALQMLKGVVQASMRDREYQVEINFTDDWNISSATCTCPRGQYLCHHMACLALYGHYNISVTDKECAWAATRADSKTAEKVCKMTDLYPVKIHRATERNATEEEIETLRHKLEACGGAVGFTWLLRKDVPMSLNPELVVQIEDIVFSAEYLQAPDKETYFLEHTAVSENTILAVAQETIGQQKNERWLLYRKHRLTASNFGVVLNACRRNRYPPYLFKRLAGSYDLDHIRAVQWGRDNEKQAIVAAEKALNIKVEQTGLWLHTCGFLGASPDGFVGENRLIEVKCPYKYRETGITEAIRKNHDYIIMADDEGNVSVNKQHEYFQQIQGQLAVTGKEACYLVVWTPKEVIIVEIQRENFDQNWEILKTFYLQHYVKFLTGELHSIV